MTPILQKSTEESYPHPSNISGATYSGVPHNVVNSSLFITTLDNPKSDIFIMEESSVDAYNIFYGLRSLCTIPMEWQYLIASTIGLIISAASFS